MHLHHRNPQNEELQMRSPSPTPELPGGFLPAHPSAFWHFHEVSDKHVIHNTLKANHEFPLPLRTYCVSISGRKSSMFLSAQVKHLCPHPHLLPSHLTHISRSCCLPLQTGPGADHCPLHGAYNTVLPSQSPPCPVLSIHPGQPACSFSKIC